MKRWTGRFRVGASAVVDRTERYPGQGNPVRRRSVQIETVHRGAPRAAKEPIMIETNKRTTVEEIAFHVAGGSAAPRWSAGAPANDCARPGSLVDLRFAPTTAGRFAGGRFPLRPRRIVVGLDFSPISEGARRLALGLARASGAVVDLVGVLDAFGEIFVRHNDRLLAGPAGTAPD